MGEVMGKLDGKVAFITGGGAGIAKACAAAFAREGAKVGLLELNREMGQSAEKEICAAGGDAFFVETDVTDEISVRNGVEAVVSRYGRLDIIVNCAGGSVPEDLPVQDMDLDVWMRVVKLNLLHPFLCSRYGIPHLIKAGGGSIIHFTSHKGLLGTDRPAYSASKGGIVALTKTMAAQCAPHNIRVNAIAPAGVLTERTARQHATATPQWLAYLAKRKKAYPFADGKPEDIAPAALFLASDDSRMFTGTTLRADGGNTSYLNF